ncbi:hypothetical protein NIZ92_17280 [Alcaligenes sp. 1735tsa3]|uniref:hypothetical protein n=1 Tax=Alcaligenes sp. 1735tsa3 TaxID=2953809 RepID=UPI0020A82004|nr:hypothetical protein [Alcaligenes sp. 1735tsa3]USY25035.1 hypothetical protein NIZ92_17280 [Alcaligenes sp. 1735tsa3]
MVVFIRSYLRHVDGKLAKYLKVLDEAQIPYHFVGWERGTVPAQRTSNDTYYTRPAALGAGWRSLIGIAFWNAFVLRWLLKNNRKIDLVHAIDLDTAMAVKVYAVLCRKPWIFDVYDKYSSLRYFPGALGRWVDKLENYLLKTADVGILADPCRIAQQGIDPATPSLMVLENVPQKSEIQNYVPVSDEQPVKIAYFGVLEAKNRGLEDLLAACEQSPACELHVAGYGPLADLFTHSAQKHPHIHYYGAQSSVQGLQLMQSCQIVVGMYYKTVPNHLFAAPNKYYEHLMLGRAMLTTAGIPTATKVLEHQTGWAVEEGQQAIEAWLKDLDMQQVQQAAARARGVWQAQYADYFDQHYAGQYLQKVQALRKS